jgi:hypothetical protein
MDTYWLSFIGDTGHLGCCIVQVEPGEDPINKAWELHCNPGGEVLFMQMDIDPKGRDIEIAKWGIGKIFTAEQMKADKRIYVTTKGKKI